MRGSTSVNVSLCRAGVLVVFAIGLIAATTAAAESYTYDALSRLTSVTNDNGVVTYYCYDAAGNRTYAGPATCS